MIIYNWAINSNRKCWIYTLLTIPMYQFLHRSLRRWLFAVEPFYVEVTMYRRCVRCVTSRCPQRCGFFQWSIFMPRWQGQSGVAVVQLHFGGCQSFAASASSLLVFHELVVRPPLQADSHSHKKNNEKTKQGHTANDAWYLHTVAQTLWISREEWTFTYSSRFFVQKLKNFAGWGF